MVNGGAHSTLQPQTFQGAFAGPDADVLVFLLMLVCRRPKDVALDRGQLGGPALGERMEGSRSVALHWTAPKW